MCTWDIKPQQLFIQRDRSCCRLGEGGQAAKLGDSFASTSVYLLKANRANGTLFVGTRGCFSTPADSRAIAVTALKDTQELGNRQPGRWSVNMPTVFPASGRLGSEDWGVQAGSGCEVRTSSILKRTGEESEPGEGK